MPPLWSRIGPLAAATFLLIGSAYKQPSQFGTALLGAGLVVLGAWLAAEVGAIINAHYLRTHDTAKDEGAESPREGL